MVRNSSSRFLDVFGSSSSTITTTTTTTTTSASHGLVAPYVSHSALLDHSSKHISPLALSPGHPQFQQSTRVQLQRQRLRDHAANALVSNTIPGFKTSAAFFASLRTNLRLSTSPPPSPMSTPPSMRASNSSLPPPSPLSAAVDATDDAAADPLAGVPELTSYTATTEEDKIEGLRLVADSVAQMRQSANTLLIWHPVNLATVVASMAIMVRIMQNSGKDWVAITMAAMSLAMVYIASFRMFTHGYISAAEGINFTWAGDSDILLTKFGDEIIGTVIVEWLSADSRQKRKKAVRGEIRGWTVKRKYRGKGVGVALLEDTVRMGREKGAESIEFADDHANSVVVLHKFYNGYFVRKEKKARAKIQELFDSSSRSKRK